MTARRQQPQDAALKAVLFILVVPVMVAIVFPLWIAGELGGLRTVSIGSISYIGTLPLILGAAIYVKCAFDFAVRGRGCPSVLAQPRVLATGGIYGVTRNPMLLGLGLVLVGEALLAQSATLMIECVGYAAICHLSVIRLEEPRLRGMFFPGYDLYCARVPRWPSLARRDRLP